MSTQLDFIGDARRGGRVLFYTESGVATVDKFERTCDCGAKLCPHLKVIHDIEDNGAKNFRHTAKSGLHKAIRRGDAVAAQRWAVALDRAYNDDTKSAKYIADIVFEETRSTKMFLAFQKRGVGWQAATVLATAPKKWELPWYDYAEKLRGFEIALGQYHREAIDRLLGATDAALLHAATWCVRLSPDNESLTEFFKDSWRERAKEHGGLAEKVANARWHGKHYVADALIDLVLDRWKPQADFNQILFSLRDEQPVIPLMDAAIFDPHTAEGLKVYKKNLAKLAPGEPQPEGMDARWSGLARGSLWRSCAVKQFASAYREKRWEEVEIDKDLWKLAVRVDEVIHPKLARK